MRLKEIVLASSILTGSLFAQDSTKSFGVKCNSDKIPCQLEAFYQAFCLGNTGTLNKESLENSFKTTFEFYNPDSLHSEYRIPLFVSVNKDSLNVAEEKFKDLFGNVETFGRNLYFNLPLNFLPDLDSLSYVERISLVSPTGFDSFQQ